jgi:16S rRNA (uracil1498-N3)-methyltransferase
MPHDLPRLFITSAQQIAPDRATLTAEQVHYLYRVLRLQTGDRAILLNGQGQGWIATLTGDQANLLSGGDK